MLKDLVESIRFDYPMPINMNPVAAADYYNDMHSSWDATIERSYSSLSDMLVYQFDALVDLGYKFTFISGEPYPNSQAMFADLDYKHLRVRKSLGDNYIDIAGDHPMHTLVQTAYGLLLLNDVFRAVHDILGHYTARASFNESGEALAWLNHRATFPSSAHLALWCETRGQNTWTNFWDNHQSLPLRERPFAVQKYGRVPGELL